jgi:2-phospho-L-lactate/phosphoenolpyruvate guanylyltransferase
VRTAVARGASRVLLVPGDCPALDAAEVDALLDEAGPGVVIVPDRHGAGTNALLLDPPTVIGPAFGPGSFARHAALAKAAGVPVRVGRLPSLELDVDTPGDLAALRAALEAGGRGAPRTRALLERLAHAA